MLLICRPVCADLCPPDWRWKLGGTRSCLEPHLACKRTPQMETICTAVFLSPLTLGQLHEGGVLDFFITVLAQLMVDQASMSATYHKCWI